MMTSNHASAFAAAFLVKISSFSHQRVLKIICGGPFRPMFRSCVSSSQRTLLLVALVVRLLPLGLIRGLLTPLFR